MKDIPSYITHVHGLKTAAAFVGADELSEFAWSLEEAGMNGNTDFINEHTSDFIKNLNISFVNIQNWLKSDDSVDSGFNIDIIVSELDELKDALFNADEIKTYTIVIRLLKETVGYDIHYKLKKISDCILTGDYDEAALLVDALYFN